MLRILVLSFLLLGCQRAEAPKPVPLPPLSVLKADTALFCRESPDDNKARVADRAAAGWQYAGPLHNDGVNCTMTLWQCFDAKASCAASK